MVEIVSPSPEHAALIESLLDHAFGANRHSKISYRYRDGVPPIADLSWVALSNGELLGSIQFWPARLHIRPLSAHTHCNQHLPLKRNSSAVLHHAIFH